MEVRPPADKESRGARICCASFFCSFLHLDVRDERHAEIDGEAAHGVVDEDALGELVGEHEHLGDL